MAKKEGTPVDVEILLKLALYHEWGEAILGDYPHKSPSYRSYFEEDIRKINKKAERKARQSMVQDLQESAGQNYEDLFDSPDYQTERDLFSIADEMAILIEVIDMRHKGYEKYEWFDHLWENQLSLMEDKVKEYGFLHPLLTEIKEAYQENKKPNPYLTKPEFQKKKLK